MTDPVLRTVSAGDLDIAYLESGPPDGPPVVLLHGFPYDVHAYDAVVPRLTAAGRRCIVPWLRGYGPTRLRSPDLPRSGQQAALGADLLALMDALALPPAVLAGFDWGGRAATIAAILRPERVRGLVSGGAGLNLHDMTHAAQPAAPAQERRSWYVYYLATGRGRRALETDRRGLCRFLWQHFSPGWRFGDAVFDRSATSFDNPDFVDVVLHSYRVRIGEVAGDPRHEATEARLSARPPVQVPAIVLQGADSGVSQPSSREQLAADFPRLQDLRVLAGVGHALPYEAPEAFAQAVLAL